MIAALPVTRTTDDRARLLDSFLLGLEAEGRSPATRKLYRHGVRSLYAFLDGMGLQAPLANVSAEHLRAWLAAERRSGVSPATLAALHKSARAFWKFLVEEGEAQSSPVARISAPSVPETVVPALTSDQIGQLLRSCRADKTTLGARDEALIAMLADTGLRAGELLQLTVEGIDRKERRALVMGKGARERVVCFEPRTLRLLDRYHRRASSTSGAIFCDRSGKPLSPAALYLLIRRRGEQVGIKRLHPHTFRHTAASALLENGLLESDVRTLMGWSRSSRMLERYTASRATERALSARQKVRLIQ